MTDQPAPANNDGLIEHVSVNYDHDGPDVSEIVASMFWWYDPATYQGDKEIVPFDTTRWRDLHWERWLDHSYRHRLVARHYIPSARWVVLTQFTGKPYFEVSNEDNEALIEGLDEDNRIQNEIDRQILDDPHLFMTFVINVDNERHEPDRRVDRHWLFYGADGYDANPYNVVHKLPSTTEKQAAVRHEQAIEWCRQNAWADVTVRPWLWPSCLYRRILGRPWIIEAPYCDEDAYERARMAVIKRMREGEDRDMTLLGLGRDMILGDML